MSDENAEIFSKEDLSVFMNCRFYERHFPEVDELVMVRVNQVTDFGVYVSLLEYNNKEGIILLSNLSRKRIRSVNKYVRVGRLEVLQVLQVTRVDKDKDKGYIDLSKKLIQKKDIATCMERFKKSRQVHSIMQRVAIVTKTPLEKLYKLIAWPLYAKYGHAFDGFKQIVTNESILDKLTDQNLSSSVREELLNMIHHRMAIHPVNIQANIEVTCFTLDGIDAIKTALRTGIDCGTEEEPITIQLIVTPLYMMSISTLDPERGIQMQQRAIKAIRKDIKSKQGSCTVKVEPRVVHD